MKQIVKLDEGRYVQLDTYGKSSNLIGNLLAGSFVMLMFTAIATMTVSAMLGADPTEPFQPTHIQTTKQ
jgi:hypothetical protein